MLERVFPAGQVPVSYTHLDVYKRQGVYDAPTDTAQFGVEGVAEEVIQVAPMPGAPVMEAIIAALS